MELTQRKHFRITYPSGLVTEFHYSYCNSVEELTKAIFGSQQKVEEFGVKVEDITEECYGRKSEVEVGSVFSRTESQSSEDTGKNASEEGRSGGEQAEDCNRPQQSAPSRSQDSQSIGA